MKKFLSVSDLHGRKRWMDWILRVVSDYDALLLPGDLLNSLAYDFAREYVKIGEFLAELDKVGRPVLICTGNHDLDLFNRLPACARDLKNVYWDRASPLIAGVRMRIIGYMAELPVTSREDVIWLYHEPPHNSPTSLDRRTRESFGCPSLSHAAIFEAQSLPPLVISGHQHSPANWSWCNGRTLFLNSGQDFESFKPRHLIIELSVEQKMAVIKHSSHQNIVRHSWK